MVCWKSCTRGCIEFNWSRWHFSSLSALRAWAAWNPPSNIYDTGSNKAEIWQAYCFFMHLSLSPSPILREWDGSKFSNVKGLFDCSVILFLQCWGGEESASFTWNLILLLLYLFSGVLRLASNKKERNQTDTLSKEKKGFPGSLLHIKRQ